MTDILAQLFSIASLYLSFALIHYRSQIYPLAPDIEDDDDGEDLFVSDEPLSDKDIEKAKNVWVAITGLYLLWGIAIGFVLGITLSASK